MKKTVQFLTPEYLEECKKMTPLQIAQFLEDFRQLQALNTKDESILISLKVPASLLGAFKTKSQLERVKYQTQIKTLMKKWLTES